MSNHVAFVALGSNLPTAPRVLEWTRRKMRAIFSTSCRFSHAEWTEPIDYPYPYKFLNQIVMISTERSRPVLEVLLSHLEDEMQLRRVTVDEGRIVMDIDLLTFDGDILRPTDWERDYVKRGVEELIKKNGRKF